MNYQLWQRPWPRHIVWEILLAAIFAAIIFAILVMATGGLLISLFTAALALVFSGLFHYLLWGQALLYDAAQERKKADEQTRRQRDQLKSADQVVLPLNEQERVELIHALEQWLAGPTAGVERPRAIESIRGVLDRLHGFGA